MESKDLKNNAGVWNPVVSGALSRATTAIIMCPADTIKTRLQFQGNLKSVRSYRNVSDAFFSILKEEGPMGFARGLGARLVYLVPSAAITFFLYEKVLVVFHNPQKTGGYKHAVLPTAGMVASRMLSTVSRTPFDVVKQRLQVEGTLKDSTNKYKNTIQATRRIWKDEGIRGMFSATHAAILRDAPFQLLNFGIYEISKKWQRQWLQYRQTQAGRSGEVTLTPYHHLIAGAIAGAVASALTNPLDVVKTRLQTQQALYDTPSPSHHTHSNISSSMSSKGSGDRMYRGVTHAFVRIWQEEGMAGMTRGMVARVVYIAPSAALIFALYEQYKKIFRFLDEKPSHPAT